MKTLPASACLPILTRTKEKVNRLFHFSKGLNYNCECFVKKFLREYELPEKHGNVLACIANKIMI